MTSSVRFLLGHEARELRDVDPTQTVLQWLRTDARANGTKEGCAEGDCGACTVVIGAPDGRGGMRYRAVNACILFVPTLDGCQLLTVEHLQRDDGALHPVQQAMVDYHGSQCGFCTPGFVMSLFALYLTEDRPTRQRVNDVLAGNLCRCTGYRPIVDAAMAMYDYAWEDHTRARAAETAERLSAMRRDDTLALEHDGRRYFAPVNAAGLAAVLADHPQATLLAGGTDVGLWVTKQHRDLDTVVYVGDVAELHGIEERSDGVEIGAAVTHSEAYATLERYFPDFGELMRRFASVQIRNSGTLGGNIANGSPIGDSMPVLIALGARLVLRGPDGQRELPLEDYFIDYGKQDRGPGEFVERIKVPALADNEHFRCYKISKRFDQDISAVCAAFKVRIADGRVVEARTGFGGVAATPRRARHTEAELTGQRWNEETVQKGEAALTAEFTPLTDMRASQEYRRLVTAQLLRKFYIETTQPGEATRVLAEEAEA
ncbi:xanthine dehydrogenase small subunit [Arhodomonas sp. AD133]|uniref:xanthine dehydrogenase small subunit n=1 Tax=Arhodomonas sp. AD133 TaxID=3415009 RepID=UPI003EC069E2